MAKLSNLTDAFDDQKQLIYNFFKFFEDKMEYMYAHKAKTRKDNRTYKEK